MTRSAHLKLAALDILSFILASSHRLLVVGIVSILALGNVQASSASSPLGGGRGYPVPPQNLRTSWLIATDSHGSILPCDNSWRTLENFTVPQGGSETYYTNTELAGSISAVDYYEEIRRGFRTWNEEINDCGRPDFSSFNFQRAGETTAAASLFLATPSSDGINVVAFMDFTTIPDAPLGAIAATRVFFDGGRVLEFDITLDNRVLWATDSTPGTFDLWNAVASQVGRPIGLVQARDLENSLITMFAYTWPGDTGKRTLALGDMLGLEQKSATRP